MQKRKKNDEKLKKLTKNLSINEIYINNNCYKLFKIE